jgi:hypothetical protein
MKYISISCTFLAFAAVIVCGILYLKPQRDRFLHSDKVARLANQWHGDRKRWEEHLGRTEYLSQAWMAVDAGNKLWNSRQYRPALDSWWKTAKEFHDTDAAYASLSNIAMTQYDGGNRRESLDAMQTLLQLPLPNSHERDMAYANYRHEACVKLADHYERIGEFTLAERFMFQALHQDARCDSCANYRWSFNLDLENRLQSLLRRQSK